MRQTILENYKPVEINDLLWMSSVPSSKDYSNIKNPLGRYGIS